MAIGAPIKLTVAEDAPKLRFCVVDASSLEESEPTSDLGPRPLSSQRQPVWRIGVVARLVLLIPLSDPPFGVAERLLCLGES